jgi:hypothetical protein
MTYSVPPGPAPGMPPSGMRPSTVTWAVYLLYALALVQVINGATALALISPLTEVYEIAYRDIPDAPEGAAGVTAMILGGGLLLIGVLAAIAFAVVAIFDARGKNPARIVTWVFAGIGVCCFGFFSAGTAANSMVGGVAAPTGTGGPGPDPVELQRLMDQNIPGWYAPTSTALFVISLLLCIVVIVLLALPASNQFFRRPEPTWQPPNYPPIG